MKKIFCSISAIALIVGFAACKKSSSPAPTTANVMFVDGCAGTTNVDVSVNSTKLASAMGIAFLKNSGYVQVTQGSDSISFILSSLGTPLKSGSGAFTASSNYSVFAGGLVTGPGFVLLSDDLSAPTSGNAKVRFVNLSTDALSETVNFGSIVAGTAVVSMASTPFSTLAAGSYTIKAGDPANISSVVSVGPQTLAAGKIYTVMLTGTLAGTGTSGLTLTLINNN